MSPAASWEQAGDGMAPGEADSRALCPYVSLGQRATTWGPTRACRGRGDFDWSYSCNFTFCSPDKVEEEGEIFLKAFLLSSQIFPHVGNLVSLFVAEILFLRAFGTETFTQ